MAKTLPHVSDPSLNVLLAEVRRRMSTESLTLDQQQCVLSLIPEILQVCGKTRMQSRPEVDMQEIREQSLVKRALEVAAAGGHGLLMIGPPGAGKRFLAQSVPSILPSSPTLLPFRAPDASIGATAFVGDATYPGELMLADGGVLFLEDLGNWPLDLLTALRHTIETQHVTFSSAEVPTHFLLVASMTPCPCGFFNDPLRECRCSAEEIISYLQRIQNVVDTCFEIHIEVPQVQEAFLRKRSRESSADIRQRVEDARARQHLRYGKTSFHQVNADFRSIDEVERYCSLTPSAEKLLHAAFQQLHFTPRQVMTELKVALSIADLARSAAIESNHIAEAIQYRPRS